MSIYNTCINKKTHIEREREKNRQNNEINDYILQQKLKYEHTNQPFDLHFDRYDHINYSDYADDNNRDDYVVIKTKCQKTDNKIELEDETDWYNDMLLAGGAVCVAVGGWMLYNKATKKDDGK